MKLHQSFSSFRLLIAFALLTLLFIAPAFGSSEDSPHASSLTIGLTSSGTLACGQLSVTLTATTSNGEGQSSYLFTGPNDFSALNTTGLLSVSAPGAYSVVVTNAVCSCSASATANVSSSLHPDYLPLVDLYNATNGPNWTNKTGWLTNCDPCNNWKGIYCQNGRVYAIELSNNNLTGYIPTSFGSLTTLEFILFETNQLTDSIPFSLTNLANLQSISLRRNQLRGSIPASFDRLKRLKNLALSQNNLTGNIPTSLTALTSLQELDLAYNQLMGTIPASISNLANLSYLKLNNNQFSGYIPTSLSALTKLQSIALSFNQLTGPIPTGLGNLAQLRHLLLSKNQLSGSIPFSLSSLTNIIFFDLTDNQLTGEIPSALGALTKTLHFSLAFNQLTGPIPVSLGSLTAVQSLYLSSNQLTGNIPSSLSGLTNLQSLGLENNQLRDCIPASLSTLCGKNIDLSNNPSLPGGGDWKAFCATGKGSSSQLATLKDGSWHDRSIWSCGSVPSSQDTPTIKHAVTIPSGQTAQAFWVRYEQMGKVLFGTGSKLQLGQ